MPNRRVWKRVNDEDIQKVYHCVETKCRFNGIKVAVSSINQKKVSYKCTCCGEKLVYSHTEVSQ